MPTILMYEKIKPIELFRSSVEKGLVPWIRSKLGLQSFFIKLWNPRLLEGKRQPEIKVLVEIHSQCN